MIGDYFSNPSNMEYYLLPLPKRIERKRLIRERLELDGFSLKKSLK